MSNDVGKIATCSRCFKQKEIEIHTTVRGKNNFEWRERLCKECSDKEYRRSCELCGQILVTWDYKKHLTDNHSKEDIAKL
jgi:hypothetical protein